MSIAKLELRPGEQINLIYKTNIKTPLGSHDQEIKVALSYEDIVQKFSKNTKPLNRKDRNQGTKFGFKAAYVNFAVTTGKWKNGAVANFGNSVEKLLTQFKELDNTQYQNIRATGLKALKDLSETKKLEPETRDAFKEIYEKVVSCNLTT